jgi:hypothetical protein
MDLIILVASWISILNFSVSHSVADVVMSSM